MCFHSCSQGEAFYWSELTRESDQFIKLRTAYTQDGQVFRSVYFNYLLDLDAPFLLGVSACRRDDPEEDEKIRVVTRETDRYFSLLQLQNVYDSNEFADSLFRISAAIREKDPDTYRDAFDTELRAAITARRNISDPEPLSYAAFKQTGISLNTRFKRYFFARIDEFIAEKTNVNVKHPIADLVTKTGIKNGFHVEHILSWNDENRALFAHDEERFEQERNRLGGILLLKGKDNISSNNEPYQEKLKSYANTLYWNETLRSDSYKSKLDLLALKKECDLDLAPLEKFGPDELEARHKLLFKLIGIIWN